MVHIAWLIGTVVVLGALNYLTTALLLRENRRLVRAIVSNNAKDLLMLERAEPAPRGILKRRVPERETEFTEPAIRPMGL